MKCMMKGRRKLITTILQIPNLFCFPSPATQIWLQPYKTNEIKWQCHRRASPYRWISPSASFTMANYMLQNCYGCLWSLGLCTSIKEGQRCMDTYDSWRGYAYNPVAGMFYNIKNTSLRGRDTKLNFRLPLSCYRLWVSGITTKRLIFPYLDNGNTIGDK